MGRKVFVSVLGTGRNGQYDPCKYGNRSEGFEYETKFIQEATLRYLVSKGEEWTPDKIIILLTEKARETTWEYLQPILSGLAITDDIEGVSITDGKNESEIWENFSILYDQLQEKDELFFDLTHGFRYLPMLVLTVGNYAHFLKGTVVRSITYGSLEGKDEEGLAPIIDLLPLSQIQDWSYAVGEYTLTGAAERIMELCKGVISPQLSAGKKDSNLVNLSFFAETLNRMVDERRTCRGLSVLRSISYSKLDKSKGELKKELIRAFGPIIDMALKDAEGISVGEDIKNLYHSAAWCCARGLYQQTITFLLEGMITKICLDEGLDIVSQRNVAASAFFLASPKDDRERDEPVVDSNLSAKIAASIDSDTVNLYNRIRRLRNDINHCGFRGEEGQKNNKPMKTSQLEKDIKEVLASCRPFFLKDSNVDKPEAVPVFINLSNHPYSTWSEAQLTAARSFGDLLYLEFPTVDPGWDDVEIYREAGKIVRAIKQMAPDPESATVHIMGEMTMTYTLVETFKDLGYRCVASTTERNSWTNEQGDKVVSFKFVRFREY